ncbi:MAG: pyridoxamine 5-phosphate oxidase [Actinomycetota bacterium]
MGLDSAMTSRQDISAMRRQYGEVGLVESDLPSEPLALFNTWLKDAVANEPICINSLRLMTMVLILMVVVGLFGCTIWNVRFTISLN